MFNIFKKSIQLIETKQYSTQEIIEEIHEAFDTAEDRLLKESEEMLESLNITTETKIEEKAERLEKIGFINTNSVVKNKKIKEKIQKNQQKLVKTKEFADMIRYYKQTYPFQKFLTEEELDKICNKYSLIYAPISNYIEDVPEKNINDIENLKPLLEKDQIEMAFKLITSTNNKEFQQLMNLLGHPTAEFTQKEINDLILKYYGNNPKEWTFEARENTWLYVIKEKIANHLSYDSYNYRKVEKIDKSGLFIAAPHSHFNLENVSKESKYGFFNKSITEVKDPIVFRYCKGGVQVITKWGFEANDEIIQNPIEN